LKSTPVENFQPQNFPHGEKPPPKNGEKPGFFPDFSGALPPRIKMCDSRFGGGPISHGAAARRADFITG
jgi:hypothetical protein